MKHWVERAPEIAYLLNPAFCARLLLKAIKSYEKESKRKMPYSLIYLILPIVLHKETRNKANSKSKMLSFLGKNPELLVGFAERAKSLVQITNEALIYLLSSKLVFIDKNGGIGLNPKIKTLSETKYSAGDVKKCLSCSEAVGKWFARSGDEKTIYISWGVKP